MKVPKFLRRKPPVILELVIVDDGPDKDGWPRTSRRYRWPVARKFRNFTNPAGALLYAQGDDMTCPTCHSPWTGSGSSLIE